MADEILTLAEVLDIDAQVMRSSGDESFGITPAGFLAKPFGRLLAERIATAQALFGADLDLTAGSVIRKLLELTALEDARTWAALARTYDDAFVATAQGEALSRLGSELGIARPYLCAAGEVTLTLVGDLPAGTTEVVLPTGARLTTPQHHRVALAQSCRLTPLAPSVDAAVVALWPGPGHNLDPAQPDTRLDRWDDRDPALADYLRVRRESSGVVEVRIQHTAPLSGGDRVWDDARYRAALLTAPRSIWTVEAIESAAALVTGVRQVQVRDPWGGLDLDLAIFGNFNFLERLFASARDPAGPAYLQVLVVTAPGVIWDGPGGMLEELEETLEDVRPVGVGLRIEQAEEVGVAIGGRILAAGLPLPAGDADRINASAAADALRSRLLARVRTYVDGLRLGEPVRASEVVFALLSEEGVLDVRDLELVRFPVSFERFRTLAGSVPGPTESRTCGENLSMTASQVAVFVDDPTRLAIVRA